MRYIFPFVILCFVGWAFALIYTFLPSSEWRSESNVPEYTIEEMREIAERAEKNEAAAAAHRRFRRRMYDVELDLRSGRMTLADAADALHAAAETDNAFFLRVVANRFPDLPARERLAVLLIDHLSFDSAGDLSPTGPVCVDALADELQHWPGVKSATLATADAVRKHHGQSSKPPTQ